MGYRKALEKHGIRLDERRIKYGDAGMTRGYELCKELIADGVPFSALFACNDDMALGASKALHQAGLKIPQDISLFGLTMPQARNGWSLRSHRFICPSTT
jgi:DNA-binding LacI/PurR family transcriptional regulator